MNKAELIFKIHGYWHAGTGSGEGSNLDALVVKSPAGLPYLPGKTVKGLLREAVQTAEDCKQVTDGMTEKLFGRTSQERTRFETVPGILRFETATLGKEMEAWAEENSSRLSGLYAQFSSTRIEDTGIGVTPTFTLKLQFADSKTANC